jgi:hypothetical protein
LSSPGKAFKHISLCVSNLSTDLPLRHRSTPTLLRPRRSLTAAAEAAGAGVVVEGVAVEVVGVEGAVAAAGVGTVAEDMTEEDADMDMVALAGADQAGVTRSSSTADRSKFWHVVVQC